ncbi:hypothetical protein BC751_4035 [Cecembia calidifontis]|uniref:Uncharacterized protein n=1 Tax=Cecembia calidifontis TaxID=1187080 RepID=A0A4Q7PDN8_9BACT|nr:hypothetical protein BC751_4035 [Cecembia calidifontis]
MKKFNLVLMMLLFLTSIGSIDTLSAKQVWCGWDNDLQACWAGGLHGYCAYCGPDCTTTIPTVRP